MHAGTLFEALGGAAGLLGLARAWHARLMGDEVMAHAFSHVFHRQHTERLRLRHRACAAARVC